MTNEDALYLVDNINEKDNWIIFDSTNIERQENVTGIITSDNVYIRAGNGLMIVMPTNIFSDNHKINKMWLTASYKIARTLVNISSFRLIKDLQSTSIDLIFDANDKSNLDDIIDKYNL